MHEETKSALLSQGAQKNKRGRKPLTIKYVDVYDEGGSHSVVYKSGKTMHYLPSEVPKNVLDFVAESSESKYIENYKTRYYGPVEEDEPSVFSKNLVELLARTATTQKELALAIETSPQNISLYATGQSEPNLNTLIRIASYFHVTIDYLLGCPTDVQHAEIMEKQYRRGLEDGYKEAIRLLTNLFQESQNSDKNQKKTE